MKNNWKQWKTIINSLVINLEIFSYFIAIYLFMQIDGIDKLNIVLLLFIVFIVPLIIPIIIEFLRRKIFGLPTVYSEIVDMEINGEKFHINLIKKLETEYELKTIGKYIEVYGKESTYEEEFFLGKKNIVIIDYSKILKDKKNPQKYIKDIVKQCYNKKLLLRFDEIISGKKSKIEYNEVYIIIFVEQSTTEILNILNDSYIHLPRETRVGSLPYEITPCIIPFAIANGKLIFGEFVGDNKFFLNKKNDIKKWINKVNDNSK